PGRRLLSWQGQPIARKKYLRRQCRLPEQSSVRHCPTERLFEIWAAPPQPCPCQNRTQDARQAPRFPHCRKYRESRLVGSAAKQRLPFDPLFSSRPGPAPIAATRNIPPRLLAGSSSWPPCSNQSKDASPSRLSSGV